MRGHLIEVFKIMSGIGKVNALSLFSPRKGKSKARRHTVGLRREKRFERDRRDNIFHTEGNAYMK